MATQRYRLQYKFWLNQENAAEKEISDIIEWLKNARAYSKAVRDGLRLIWDLGHCRVGVLLELFPDVCKWLEVPEPPKSNPSDDDIKRQIADLRLLILERGGNRITDDAPLVAAPPLKQLSKGLPAALALPVFDDDDDADTIVLNKAAVSDNSANFMAMMSKIAF